MLNKYTHLEGKLDLEHGFELGDRGSNLWGGLHYTEPVPDLDREVEAWIYETSHEPAETEANVCGVMYE